MLIISFTLIIFILSVAFAKKIHKYNYFIYIAAFILAIIATGEEANILSLGYVPLSFFIVVMYTGAFGKSYIKKRLMTVRAENAIIGSILLIPHAYGFLEFYLDDGIFFSSIVPSIGVIALIIIIPLFVTSFRIVRKRINYKQWKKLHQLSYVLYLAIFLHLLFINNSRVLIYDIIFIGFFFMKAYDKLKIYYKEQLKLQHK